MEVKKPQSDEDLDLKNQMILDYTQVQFTKHILYVRYNWEDYI